MVRSFTLLLHCGSASSPSLHLVTAEAHSTAEALADELLTESPDGVGVEVWEGDQRLYARGVVPLRAETGFISEDGAGDGVMRSYEVRVHRGRAVPPERHSIVAASNEAAAERAQQLYVESPDAIAIEVICAGERLRVRGVVHAATAPSGHSQRLDSEQRSRLWDLMQRIERSRHRAELAEAKTAKGSAAFRVEMAEIAQEWRDLARHIEAENTVSNVHVARVGEGEAASSPIVSTAPPGRVGGLRRWPGVVVGMVIGALSALALATPRWIETTTGVDIDRGSGALEWAMTVVGPLAAIAAAFAVASPPRVAREDRPIKVLVARASPHAPVYSVAAASRQCD